MFLKRLICSLTCMLLLCSWGHAYEYEYAAEIFLDAHVSGIGVSPDSDELVAICSDLKTLFFVDIETSAVVHQEQLLSVPRLINMNLVLNQVLVATEQQLLVYDLASRKKEISFPLESAAQSLAVTEDGGWALVGVEGAVLSVDLQSGELHKVFEIDGNVTDIRTVGQTAALAVNNQDGENLQLLDIDSGEVFQKAPLPGNPASVNWYEDTGSLLLTFENVSGLHRYDIDGLKSLPAVETGKPGVGCH